MQNNSDIINRRMLAQLELLSMQVKSFWAYVTEHRQEICFTGKFITAYIHVLGAFDKTCDLAIYDVKKHLRDVLERTGEPSETH